MPDTASRPHVSLAVALAREAIEARGVPGEGDGPCGSEVEGTAVRTHSVITVIRTTGRPRPIRYYLKTLRATAASRELKRRQAAQEFALLESLHRRFGSHPELGAVRPVQCWPDQLSILTEEFPGEKLSRTFRRARGLGGGSAPAEIAALCRAVGRWLALFQASSPPGGAAPGRVEPLLEYCERRLRLLVDERPGEFAPLAAALTRGLAAIAAAVDPADLRPVGRHNDFRPDNIMTDGTRIAVLDFTGFTSGPPLYDAVKFWMKLDDLAFGISYRRSVIEAWKRAFVEGYGAPVDLGSALSVLLRAGNVLDKLSEAMSPTRPAGLAGRLVGAARWRGQVAWLRRVAQGEGGR